MNLTEEQYLAHYGILRRSGRYPWGSGGNQPARNRMFLDTINDLRKQGMTDPEICVGLKIGSVDHFGVFHPSTTQLRAARSIAKNQIKLAEISEAQMLRDKGYGNVAIGKRMGKPESSIRALLAPGAKRTSDILISTSEMLKSEVADKKYVDVGRGVESHIGVSKERLNTAVAILKEEGYKTHRIKKPQIGTQFDTEYKVLVAPGVEWKEVQQNRDLIQQISAVSKNYGETFDDGKIHDPISVHPNRVDVVYKEAGGGDADGVIFVRPGVKDVSLGANRYAQVRVKVGNKHFLKGMAMYKDNLPEGIDLQFHTSKSDTGKKTDAMKELTGSKEYPFKTVVRQQKENIGTDKERVTSAMNLVREEGQWHDWQKSLSAQFLSKQNPALVRTQLDKTFGDRQSEFDEIQALTNPVIKKKLLEKFAEGTDAAAVHLSAAALNSRQRWHAILPVESMPPTQIYATNYNDGERVVLIRYPHAGTFEIPELTVNNNNPEAKRLLGDSPKDAVGIHPSVAQHLSGADFDGDTVIVIPNNQNRIRHTPALDELKNYDPLRYKLPDDSPIPRITSSLKEQEMGNITNLIADMTVKNAPHSEIAHAVKHSMVVIDSEKGLNYKQSYVDNGIAHLKAKYQGGAKKGASTLISKSESELHVPHRKPRPQSEGGPIDKATGRKEFVPTGETRKGPKGTPIPKTTKTTKGAETHDAHTLSSGTRMETLYADHANKLKGMANQARLAAAKTPPLQRSASAKKAYHSEVQSLTAKLLLAKRNAPLERQALSMARASLRAKKDANPELDGDALDKIKFEEQTRARNRTGAKKKLIDITPKEWDAIQAGAISTSHLTQILNNTDIDTVRALATPRRERLMTANKTSRARAMLARGQTRAEVAAQLGVSLTTLDLAMKG